MFFTETGTPLPHDAPLDQPLLGIAHGTGVYLLYNGILKDRSVDGGNVLTQTILDDLPAHDGPKVIYAASNRVSPARLKTRGIVGTPLLEINTKFRQPATYGETLHIHTSIVEWRAKVFIQKHVVMRGDVILCEGVETRAFVIHPPEAPDRIKAIPVPEDIKALCC